MTTDKLTFDELVDALSEIITPEDQIIAVFSGVWTFGHKLQCPPNEIPKFVFEALSKAAQEKRLLCQLTHGILLGIEFLTLREHPQAKEF